MICVHVLILKAVLAHLQALTRAIQRRWRLHANTLVLAHRLILLHRLHIGDFVIVLILRLSAGWISRVATTIREIVVHDLPTLPLLLTVRAGLSNASLEHAATLGKVGIKLRCSALLVTQVLHREVSHAATLRIWHIDLEILHLDSILALKIILVLIQ